MIVPNAPRIGLIVPLGEAMAIRLPNVFDLNYPLILLDRGCAPFPPFRCRPPQDCPYPPCGAKRACGHERRSRMFPSPLFLICRLLLTCQSHEGSCSHPTWHLVPKTGVQRARFRVVWGNRTLRITSEFFWQWRRMSLSLGTYFQLTRRYPCRIKCITFICYSQVTTSLAIRNVSEGGSGSVIDLPNNLYNNMGYFGRIHPGRGRARLVPLWTASAGSGETRRRGSVWRTLWASIVARQRDEPFLPLEGLLKGTT